MKIQYYAVIFIIIILPIALVLSTYTSNLIEVANRQALYDSILLDTTYDAIRAYQINTLNNDFDATNNSKIRDINASVNSFFNSLSTGLSSIGLTKNELKDYIPAILFTLYDGYYVYGNYDNIVNYDDDEEKLAYNQAAKIDNKQYGLRPYIYYSCEYSDGTDYDLIINYTLDNYIAVTGYYNNMTQYIAKSGYYIDCNKFSDTTKQLFNNYDLNAAYRTFANKKVEIKNKDNSIMTIEPEPLGEYLITMDERTVRQHI